MVKLVWASLVLILLVGCGGGSTAPEASKNILVIGQSNVREYGKGLDYNASKTTRLVDGEWVTYISTADKSTFIPVLGDLLGGAKVVNVAEGATSIGDWEHNGELFGRIAASAGALEYDIVLFQQGENDTVLGTTTEEYSRDLQIILDEIRDVGIDAPVYIAITSYAFGEMSAEVREGQRIVIDRNTGVYIGVDTDFYGDVYRHDTVHFNEAGLSAIATKWVEVLSE